MTEWREPETPPRGSVIVIAGRGETPALYERFARRLAVDGYRSTVVTSDAADATDVARAALDAAPAGIPAVIVGSDAGAALAARIAVEPPDALAGLVLAGLVASGSAAAPADWTTEVEARSACPVHRGVLAASAVPGRLADTTEPVTAEALARIGVPALAVHGESDAISPVAATLPLYDALRDADVVTVSGGRHDILNDVTHRSVAAEIVQFLERLRTPGAPHALSRSRSGDRATVAV